MKHFAEWLSEQDPHTFEELTQEGFFKNIGRKLKKIGAAVAISTAAAGGTDNVAQYSGHPLPVRSAQADQFGDYGEILSDKKRRKAQKNIRKAKPVSSTKIRKM